MVIFSWPVWLVLGLVGNAVAGLYLFQWAWKELRPVREGNEQLDR
jgi:hypothetical protein